jgi:hypothetical protein
MTTSINSFNSPFSTFIYSTISSFSTSLGPTITTRTFASTLSTNTSLDFFTNNLKTSTLTVSGTRQPFIQYGSGTLSSSPTEIILVNPYSNSNYIIQLTYTGSDIYSIPLKSTSINNNKFKVIGDSSGNFHWATYG